MRIALDPDVDRCPCGSGLLIRECCLRADGRFIPAAVSTPRPPETGYRHPRCYSSELGGCDSKISREHPISRGVLESMSGGNAVDIGGLAWLAENERRMLPIGVLASNVLCRAHNTALSGLDAFGLRFVQTAIEIARDMRTRRRRRPTQVYLFNGEDFERWMLKCLCGLVASGNAVVSVLNEQRDWRPPRLWLECLFGVTSMPPGYGLRVVRPQERSAPFEFAIFANSEVGPYGLAVSLLERDFVFSMSRYSGRTGSVLEGSAYRPTDLWTTNQINDSVLRLGWAGAHTEQTVQSTYANPRRSAQGARKARHS